MIHVKICGIVRESDAVAAAEAGADMIGFVFAESPRMIAPAAVSPIARRLERDFGRVARVGVFVDPAPESIDRALDAGRLTHLQIYGRRPEQLPEGPEWIAALPLAKAQDAALPEGPTPWGVLVEAWVSGASGGTGATFPWDWARPLLARTRLLVAGGLDAERVSDLLRMIIPYGVDASSRLETRPGEKDPRKMKAFVESVRTAERDWRAAR